MSWGNICELGWFLGTRYAAIEYYPSIRRVLYSTQRVLEKYSDDTDWRRVFHIIVGVSIDPIAKGSQADH